jgi:hypothetical protein
MSRSTPIYPPIPVATHELRLQPVVPDTTRPGWFPGIVAEVVSPHHWRTRGARGYSWNSLAPATRGRAR